MSSASINKALWDWVWEVEGLHHLYVGFFFFFFFGLAVWYVRS